jgi:hypothetical protein
MRFLWCALRLELIHDFKFMQITIDIPEQHLNRIRKWASVQRTLNESIRLLEGLCGDVVVNNAEAQEMIEANIQELKDIGPAIADLHYIVRGKIWEQDIKK